MHNHFALLETHVSFDIDLAELEKRYFAAQRRFHPDRLVGKSPEERQQSITQSMLVNEAYEALKNPLLRAQHLLALGGVGEQKAPQELLMEIMELREALSEADNAQKLEAIAKANATAKQETLAGLSKAFATNDTIKASTLAMRLSYLMKIEDEIRVKNKIGSA